MNPGNPVLSVMIGCLSCGHWNRWDRPNDSVSFFFEKKLRKCEECGRSEWAWHSMISLRTWDEVRAKKKSVKRRK